MTKEEFQKIMTILDDWINSLPYVILLYNTKAYFSRVSEQESLIENFEKSMATVMKEREFTDIKTILQKWTAQVRRTNCKSSKKDETKVFNFTEAEDWARLKSKLQEYFKENWE